MEKMVWDIVGTERRVAAWKQLLTLGVEHVSHEFSDYGSSNYQSGTCNTLRGNGPPLSHSCILYL